LKSKTLWWIIGLGVLSLLAWIGIRSFRNHRRMEEELSEYEGQGAPVIESPPSEQQPATEPAPEGVNI
jgi:hypothetical protein